MEQNETQLRALAERVRSILTEQGISARDLARRAGLKSESHVGHLLLAKIASPGAKLIEDIAAAGDVEFNWLWTGRGPRRRPRLVRDDLPAALVGAIEFAVANQPANGITNEDIERFCAAHFKGIDDLSAEDLYEDLKSDARRHRRATAQADDAEVQLRRSLAAGGATEEEIEQEIADRKR